MQVNWLYEATLNCSTPLLVHNGGSSCFDKNTKVVTKRGLIPISNVRIGDYVKSYNEQSGINEWRLVTDTLEFDNDKPTVEVTLKNGQKITVTEDHKFYFKGEWHSLKYILSLVEQINKDTSHEKRNMETDT